MCIWGKFRLECGIGIIIDVCRVQLMTHDMGKGSPLAPAQDRRRRNPEAVQNTAEGVPRREYCGDTARRGQRETA